MKTIPPSLGSPGQSSSSSVHNQYVKRSRSNESTEVLEFKMNHSTGARILMKHGLPADKYISSSFAPSRLEIVRINSLPSE